MSWDVFRHGNHPIELHGTTWLDAAARSRHVRRHGRAQPRGGDWEEMATDGSCTAAQLALCRARPGQLPDARGSRTWLTRSPPAPSRVPLAIWRCMCWRSWKPFWSSAGPGRPWPSLRAWIGCHRCRRRMRQRFRSRPCPWRRNFGWRKAGNTQRPLLRSSSPDRGEPVQRLTPQPGVAIPVHEGVGQPVRADVRGPGQRAALAVGAGDQQRVAALVGRGAWPGAARPARPSARPR